jgi:alkylation response protein AidB-like acyl-CoA dehydrogenase
MSLALNEDQSLLYETAKDLARERLPLGRLRKLREDATGFDLAVWKQFAELGWTAIPFSEEDAGLGLGLADVVCVTEAVGGGLSTEPFISNVVLAGGCLAATGSAEQKQTWLAPMIAGDKHLALALEERSGRFDPWQIATRAEFANGKYALTGVKAHVMGGNVADCFVVAARSAGETRAREGLSLFLVPREAEGVHVTRQWRVDAAPVASVRFDRVTVSESALLGPREAGATALEQAVDRATVALSAEMLGGMSVALDQTVQYLKERTQFGVAIGSFQALQHRAARLFIEVELCRSAVLAAARAIDEQAENARALVSVAKARASDAFMLVANEAIQMHGGIGMTDEHDIGFFLKRARAAEMTFGDSVFHRSRFADLQGF